MAESMGLDRLPEYASIRAAAEKIAGEGERLAALCVEIQQIPAPTGAEEKRADWVQARFRELGLADIDRDEVLNVYARIPGRLATPALLVTAHTDTVFPASTDLTVRIDPETGRIAGPSIGDNSTGLAGLMVLAEVLAGIEQPPVDIWLVANSTEEGLGDLKGIRAAVDRLQDRLGAVLVLEGMGLGRIVHAGLGVRRYRIHAHAPGGHSWGDFGSASAIHCLAALVTDITRLNVPQQPRTTYNIGKFSGGTSVNTIAQHASLELDLRSTAPETLAQLDEQVQRLVQRHQRHHQRAKSGVTFSVETIGDRPAGQIPESHPLMQATSGILAQLGIPERVDVRISSTDANIPLSRGIPSVCIGLTEGGDAHRLSEWIDPAPLPKGIQQLLYLTWWTAAWLTEEG
jgi:tripeptide aminopeptidase